MNLTKLIRSFKCAGNGLLAMVKKERNIKIELSIGLIVLISAILFKFSLGDFLLIIMLFFLIPGLEIVNSLVEEMANLLNLPNERTTFLRDLSAGLVLWFTFMAVIIGIVIFTKYLTIYF